MIEKIVFDDDVLNKIIMIIISLIVNNDVITWPKS
jgi:hypothetical protein